MSETTSLEYFSLTLFPLQLIKSVEQFVSKVESLKECPWTSDGSIDSTIYS